MYSEVGRARNIVRWRARKIVKLEIGNFDGLGELKMFLFVDDDGLVLFYRLIKSITSFLMENGGVFFHVRARSEKLYLSRFLNDGFIYIYFLSNSRV